MSIRSLTYANKAYLRAITVTNISRSFYLQDGGKNQLAETTWNKLRVRHLIIRLFMPTMYKHDVAKKTGNNRKRRQSSTKPRLMGNLRNMVNISFLIPETQKE